MFRVARSLPSVFVPPLYEQSRPRGDPEAGRYIFDTNGDLPRAPPAGPRADRRDRRHRGRRPARERGPPLVVDVRERHEWDEGRLPNAVHIPRGSLESRIERAAPDRSTPILVYCGSGTRSAFAAKTLEDLGYEHVTNLDGGIVEWKRSGLPVVVSESLAPAQRTRYSRHLLIPEVGEEGQLRLLEARILLIGAGGLGSPAALYLAAAGVGTLGIVDDDAVDATNLQRQIVHSTDRLGEPKVESAKRTIEALNPDVNVRVFRERLTSENVDRILGEGWDVIVDGADNFPTRYLVNDASVWHGIPVVHGSIFRFEGQVTVFEPGEGPCYRCLFPQPPPPELAPAAPRAACSACSRHHRLAPGERGAEARARHRRPAHRPAAALRRARAVLHRGRAAQGSRCPVCGESPTITEYIDYVEFCQRAGSHA